MAIDYTADVAEWHTLVDVALGGGTLHIAERALALDDGTVYDGRLLSLPRIEMGLQSLDAPIFTAPSLRLIFDDADGYIRDSFADNYSWAGITVTVQLGQGTAAADYETVFTGTPRFPGGTAFDDLTAEVDLDNAQATVGGNIPTDKFFPSSYPDAETKSLYQPIPYVWGDWRSTAAGGETVPCYMTDDSAGSQQYTYTICVGPIAEIEKVWRTTDGTATDITAQCSSLNTTDATFVWTAPGGSDYDPSTDAISANIAGYADSGGGTMYEYADAIAAKLCSLLSISYTANASWTSAITNADKCRRWMGQERSIWTWLSELANEAFIDWSLETDGSLKAYWRVASVPADLSVLREADLMPSSTGRAFRSQRDPENAYANQINADYRLKAPAWSGDNLETSERYAGNTVEDNATAQSNHGQVVRKRMRLRWLHNTTSIDDRIKRSLLIFAEEPEYVYVTTGPRLLGSKPTDQFSLLYSKYEQTGTTGTPMQIRRISRDLDGLMAYAECWNIDALQARRYQADGSAAWAAATDYDKTIMGYYGAFSGDDDQLWF